ncbi:MAG TPA: PaaI family thioesterase [Deltaproteobacteria bacterium]|nr:PaaI family thioesterase [Deltaproteobacteria bacterium]
MQGKAVTLTTIQRYFSGDRFAELCGIEIVETGPGYALTRLEVTDHHLNSLKMMHGGALFALADQAFAVAVHTGGKVALAINISISYLKAARGKVLVARAQEIARTSRLATCRIDITDEHDDLIATLHGMAYIKNQAID